MAKSFAFSLVVLLVLALLATACCAPGTPPSTATSVPGAAGTLPPMTPLITPRTVGTSEPVSTPTGSC